MERLMGQPVLQRIATSATDIQATLGPTFSPSRAARATTLAAFDRLLPLTACVAP